MTDKFASTVTDQLRAHLEYYREMGIDRFDPRVASGVLQLAAIRNRGRNPNTGGQLNPGNLTQASLFTESGPFPDRDASLEEIRDDIGDCQRCKLCQARTNIVFGSGHPQARLVFVGEGPGVDEDRQGLPFVGRAGQLLTKMIEAIQLRRDEVYICNVVKCRPPQNRTPEEDEITSCSPFLFRQLAVLQPAVICCLGVTAAQTLLQLRIPISRLRGKLHSFQGAQLVATYHPAYLLRNPAAKRVVWEDLKRIRSLLDSRKGTRHEGL